ncbi:glycoside hydrolase family 31 protein [Ferruginibacter sp.]|nr:glycoside hydrolase family 31 protein [Ferruginibacter sp.]
MKASIDRILVFTLITVSFSANSQSINKKLSSRPVADTNLILPPSWAFGVLYGGYTNQQETIDRIEQIKKHNYPIDAYWIDSWFWSHAEKGLGPKKFIDFVADTIGYPDRPKMWDYMKKNNIKGGFWTWDCILETGNEKAFNDFKSKGYFSGTYIETGAWHNFSTSTAMFESGSDKKRGTLCGNINFDDPQAVKYFKERMKHFFDEGADFIKLDRTSKISVCKTMFEISQEFGKETKGRGFVLSHSFETENEEYKKYPTKWTDDTRSDWNIEQPNKKFNAWVPGVALKENIAMFTDPKKPSSKIPFLTNDLGGFDKGLTEDLDEELYIRWLQFSILNPITEIFSQPENKSANMAWNYSPRADSIFRFFAKWRMQMFPYIYSYALRSRIDGKHMLGKFPENIYQYTFGDEMLVAPVYVKGTTTQKVFLPEGKWVNYWTGEQMKGNAKHTVAAPINQIPLFVKQGSIIPMRNYSSSIEKGNNNTLILHIYPGYNGSFNLLEDDGTSNDYLKGIYASTKIEMKNNLENVIVNINHVEGSYRGMKSTRKWVLHIHAGREPKLVKVNKRSVKFSYNNLTKIAVIETTLIPVDKPTLVEISYSAQ